MWVANEMADVFLTACEKVVQAKDIIPPSYETIA